MMALGCTGMVTAVAVGRFFKIPAERISRAIAAYEPTNNRSQFKKTDNNAKASSPFPYVICSMPLAID